MLPMLASYCTHPLDRGGQSSVRAPSSVFGSGHTYGCSPCCTGGSAGAGRCEAIATCSSRSDCARGTRPTLRERAIGGCTYCAVSAYSDPDGYDGCATGCAGEYEGGGCEYTRGCEYAGGCEYAMGCEYGCENAGGCEYAAVCENAGGGANDWRGWYDAEARACGARGAVELGGSIFAS